MQAIGRAAMHVQSVLHASDMAIRLQRIFPLRQCSPLSVGSSCVGLWVSSGMQCVAAIAVDGKTLCALHYQSLQDT